MIFESVSKCFVCLYNWRWCLWWDRHAPRIYGSPLSPYSIKSYLKIHDRLILNNHYLSSVALLLLHLVKLSLSKQRHTTIQSDYSLFSKKNKTAIKTWT